MKNKQNIFLITKKHAEKSITQKLVTDKKELVKYDVINNEIFFYSKSVFERMDQIDEMNHKTLLESITLPSVTNDQKLFAITFLQIKSYLML